MMSLPLTSLYEHARAGRIPGVVRVGRRVLFDLAKLNAWIDAGGDFAGVTVVIPDDMFEEDDA